MLRIGLRVKENIRTRYDEPSSTDYVERSFSILPNVSFATDREVSISYWPFCLGHINVRLETGKISR